jgi:dihydrofolate synthase/folylpolyglutamate synthase
MDYLGNTIKKIAAEKAGIIKQHYDVVVYDSDVEVLDVFREKCEETFSKLHIVNFDEISKVKSLGANQKFTFKSYESIVINLRGLHQVKNACVAIEACEVLKSKGYNINEKTVRKGLKETQWPCRLEKIDTDSEVYIDGAHNAHGVNALQEFVRGLKEEDKNRKIIFIVGILKSKKYEDMIEALSKTADEFLFPKFTNEHAVDNDELLKVALKYCKNSKKSGNIKEVLQKLSDSKEFIYIFCGSLYFAGEVRKEFANEFKARNCSISET